MITRRHAILAGLLLVLAAGLGGGVVSADAGVAAASRTSLHDHSIDWPTWAQISRVISLRDYNTRVVVAGTMLLGFAAGLIGSYMLLRRRALIGDALSHATLPGIALAFIVMVALGGTGKSLPGLLLGATVSGLLGVGCIMLIRHTTRIKEDAALGIVLSVFFGAGVALLGVIQKMNVGGQAGLEQFIYGKTASMLGRDAMLIAVAAAVLIVLCVALYKEFALLSFDVAFARAQGWPVLLIDIIMMAAVTAVTVVGLQAVGLILMIALLIIPPAAARFWTDRLTSLLVISGFIGALSGLLGALASALVPRLPAGAIIVLVAAALFFGSLVLGRRRGLLRRVIEHATLQRTIGRQHLLRAAYELRENTRPSPDQVSIHRTAEPCPVCESTPSLVPRSACDVCGHALSLAAKRSWAPRVLDRLIRRAERDGLVVQLGDDVISLTARGESEAARITRNHRLWEMYLITHADIAPSHVDRDADQIEHVLGHDLVEQLEELLRSEDDLPVPPSPHATGRAAGTSIPERRATP